MNKQQQELLWALVARGKLGSQYYHLGPPKHTQPTRRNPCREGCRNKNCRPWIKLDRKAVARDMQQISLDQLIGSDALLLRAAALDDCMTSRQELDRLVARTAFGGE